MIAIESTIRINIAVHECLNRCYISAQPVRCLTEYIMQLMYSREWTVSELASIRSATLHILRGVAAPEDDQGMPIGFALEFRG